MPQALQRAVQPLIRARGAAAPAGMHAQEVTEELRRAWEEQLCNMTASFVDSQQMDRPCRPACGCPISVAEETPAKRYDTPAPPLPGWAGLLGVAGGRLLSLT